MINNGILARVGGQYVSQGTRQLPPAAADQERESIRQAIVRSVPDLGDVRITYELKSYRHGRSRHWHWVAVHAEVTKPARGIDHRNSGENTLLQETPQPHDRGT